MASNDTTTKMMKLISDHYSTLLESDKGGKLKASTSIVSAIKTLSGATGTDIVKAFRAMQEKRAEGDAFDALAKDIAGRTVPASVVKLFDKLDAHADKFARPEGETTNDKGETVKVPAYRPRLSIVLTRSTNDKGETVTSFKLTKGAVRTGGNRKGGTKSKNSNISAWNAYQAGVKAGDPDILKQNDDGTWTNTQTNDTVKARVNGGQMGYLKGAMRTVLPKTYAVLVEYGKADA